MVLSTHWKGSGGGRTGSGLGVYHFVTECGYPVHRKAANLRDMHGDGEDCEIRFTNAFLVTGGYFFCGGGIQQRRKQWKQRGGGRSWGGGGGIILNYSNK